MRVLHIGVGWMAPGGGMAKARKRVFSILKAVKENARTRIGSPPPERVLPDPKQKAVAQPRHKETLAHLLERGEKLEQGETFE